MMTKEKIRQIYSESFLENDKNPESVSAFCKQNKIKEPNFYEHYSSFLQIDSEIWTAMFVEARISAESEEVYQNYSVREKMLAFFYTWIEVLNKNRSYILQSYEEFDKPIYIKRNLQMANFKILYYDYINELLIESYETREIEQRPIPPLMKLYPDIFWTKALVILSFWINDKSKAFEKTDTMIEKTVNTTFDLLGHSPLDSLFDLGKFILQNRK
jgi:hypothetical protein